MNRRMLLVGGGLASAKAAQALREEGFDGEVTILAGEAVAPYHRPELSKGVLHDKTTPDALAVHADGWYAEQAVDLRLGVRAMSLDLGAGTMTTDSGEVVGYDQLLLATGSVPASLPLPGGHLARTLRTGADAAGLRADLAAGGRVVVIGAGWIGLEVAAAARAAGCEVTVVETAPTALHAVLGPELGDRFARVHRDHGISFRFGAAVTEIRPDAVVLADGEVLPTDTVVAGVGARPDVELARAAGLQVDNGILVDALLRTGHPDVFAAGDVARQHHPGIGSAVRVEHWANALNQGTAAGRAMFGNGQPYQRVPYFYSDQFTLGMEYSGHVDPAGYDAIAYRGDPDSGEYIAFWLRSGLVLAGMSVNVWDVTTPIQDLVRAGWRGRQVDLDRLADPDIPLADVLGADR